MWVIAETSELPTRFVRIVVTDDRGRYVIPDLPKANYSVWVRGYGLVDSPKTKAQPGKNLNLTAVPAPNPRAAAEIYPAGYWLSLLKVPEKSEFPGGAGIGQNVKNQADWIRLIKSGGCTACHQLGTTGTRKLPKEFDDFPSSVLAWERRLQSGQAGTNMIQTLGGIGHDRALALFADWTDRIAAGEVPKAPPRPQGVERNVVITEWDWADPKAYLHDEVSTDRRNPTLNANGKIYGSLELSADYLPVLDPQENSIGQVKLTVRDPNTPPTSAFMIQPSPYWGIEPIWTSKNNVHNPMFDEKGRVWITSAVRPPDNPAFCKAGSDHPSAKLTPIERSGRQLAMYDPRSGKLTHISTCFSTHHLMFAEDANNTLWTSGGGSVVGWLNTKMFEATGDEEKSQGWTALILDTNGNGKRDDYVEPNQPVDPAKDKRYGSAFYAVVARAGRIGVGIGARIPRRDHPAVARRESAGDRARRSVRAADEERRTGRRLLAARHGHRSQRRRVGCARERPHGQLRSTQVQGTAQRSERDRTALPGGLDVLHRTVAAVEERHRLGKRRSELLHLGRSVRHVRPRREHADQHRQRIRRTARAEGRQVRRLPRAVSDRLLHEVDGWPHRRSESRAGRGRDCGRRSARARRSTWRRARGRRAR